MNTAVFMLRAKQMGLSMAELDDMEEGFVTDMMIEFSNDFCEDEYTELATQSDFDSF